jgi:CRP-like cAMP-binding protein
MSAMSASQPALLAGLSAADAEVILSLGTSRTLVPGAVLFRLGDAADAVYLIERGRIALSMPMHLGGRPQDVVVEEHDAGHTIGWSALIPPHRFTLTATAPLATTVLAIRRAVLTDFCAAQPRLGYALALNIAAVIGQRLQVVQTMWLREMQRTVDNAHV